MWAADAPEEDDTWKFTENGDGFSFLANLSSGLPVDFLEIFCDICDICDMSFCNFLQDVDGSWVKNLWDILGPSLANMTNYQPFSQGITGSASPSYKFSTIMMMIIIITIIIIIIITVVVVVVAVAVAVVVVVTLHSILEPHLSSLYIHK